MCTADGHWVFREIKGDNKHKAKITRTTRMMVMAAVAPLVHEFLRAGASGLGLGLDPN